MTKRFIITDPCYIMDNTHYSKICDEGCDFEGQSFPLSSTLCSGNKPPIVFHDIAGTPNGDGSCTFRGQYIGVDSGMLCIAECESGWENQAFGATFTTLEVAQNNFDKILSRF